MAQATQIKRRWQRSMWDLVYPPTCPLCNDSLSSEEAPPCLCESCREQVATAAEHMCPRCGRERSVTLPDGRCPACRDEVYQFGHVVCLGPYADALSEAIVRMKHAGQQSLTAGLARELVRRVRETPELSDLDVLVPIPMHWRRRVLRGAGTSQVLAEALSIRMCLPLSMTTIKCTRGTKKQSTLSPTARRKNVRGAFLVTDATSVKGLHIGLVDDTVTTGATANEAAKVLRKAGAERISLIAMARAVGSV